MLKDILMHAQYRIEYDHMCGNCGYVICSERYLEWVEDEVFDLSLKSRVDDKYLYREYFSAQLLYLREEITHDLDEGLRNNDYITDLHKDHLLLAAENLEKCGVSCYDLERKAKRLAWFVGGDPRKIEDLQRRLNDIGIFQHLKVDGVYGKKTHAVVCEFHAKLESHNVPKLVKIGEVVETGFEIADISGTAFNVFKKTQEQIADTSKDIALFNVQSGFRGERLAVKLSATGKYRNLDGLAVTGNAVHMLDSLEDSAKVFNHADKMFVATGQFFNLLELISAIYKDATDVDKKLGVGTLKSITEIVLTEVTSSAFVAAGTAGTSAILVKIGATAGTAIAPGVGTIAGAIIGGVLFALVGDTLVENVVDGLFCLVD